jgi:hypothetical protein
MRNGFKPRLLAKSIPDAGENKNHANPGTAEGGGATFHPGSVGDFLNSLSWAVGTPINYEKVLGFVGGRAPFFQL